MELFRSIGSVGGEAVGLDNLGEVYCAQGRLDEASASLAEALELFREPGQPGNESAALRGLAAVHCERGRTATALDLALEALELSREMADRRIEMDALNTLGAIHHRDGRGHEAAAIFSTRCGLAGTRATATLRPSRWWGSPTCITNSENRSWRWTGRSKPSL